MSASHRHGPQILFDALYCPEEIPGNRNTTTHTNCSMECRGGEQSSCEDEWLSYLLSKELQEIEPYCRFAENPSLVKARCEAVEWVLEAVDYFSFSALTAVLAVDYLDRFLFLYSFKSGAGEGRPWMPQLAAVACLSLAAKVEETEVPLLVDLQVQVSKYVFESNTIQRMEILILSTIEWKMNPVTPIVFLECIAGRLQFNTSFCNELLRRCECLVLSVVSDCRFMCCLPSTLATAVMLTVISSLSPCVYVEYQDRLKGILGINKGKVEDCCRLIQEVATSVDFYSRNKRKFGTMPGSPKGVVDVSFSSGSSDEWWCPSPVASVSSSPEPLSKKIKSQEEPNKECNFLI